MQMNVMKELDSRVSGLRLYLASETQQVSRSMSLMLSAEFEVALLTQEISCSVDLFGTFGGTFLRYHEGIY